MCGAGGTLEKTEENTWKFVIQEDGLDRDRTTVEGRAKHLVEIAHTQGGFYTKENLDAVNARIGKYKDLSFPSI